jgi:hypothetical protein
METKSARELPREQTKNSPFNNRNPKDDVASPRWMDKKNNNNKQQQSNSNEFDGYLDLGPSEMDGYNFDSSEFDDGPKNNTGRGNAYRPPSRKPQPTNTTKSTTLLQDLPDSLALDFDEFDVSNFDPTEFNDIDDKPKTSITNLLGDLPTLDLGKFYYFFKLN